MPRSVANSFTDRHHDAGGAARFPGVFLVTIAPARYILTVVPLPHHSSLQATATTMRSRWPFILAVSALILVAAIGGVALYLWGWRGGGNERARAFADASVISYSRRWTFEDGSRVAPGLWKARYERSDGSAACVLLDLDRFVRAPFVSAPLGFLGADPIRC